MFCIIEVGTGDRFPVCPVLLKLCWQGVANFSSYPAPYHSNAASDEDLAEILEVVYGSVWLHKSCILHCIMLYKNLY